MKLLRNLTFKGKLAYIGRNFRDKKQRFRFLRTTFEQLF